MIHREHAIYRFFFKHLETVRSVIRGADGQGEAEGEAEAEGEGEATVCAQGRVGS